MKFMCACTFMKYKRCTCSLSLVYSDSVQNTHMCTSIYVYLHVAIVPSRRYIFALGFSALILNFSLYFANSTIHTSCLGTAQFQRVFSIRSIFAKKRVFSINNEYECLALKLIIFDVDDEPHYMRDNEKKSANRNHMRYISNSIQFSERLTKAREWISLLLEMFALDRIEFRWILFCIIFHTFEILFKCVRGEGCKSFAYFMSFWKCIFRPLPLPRSICKRAHSKLHFCWAAIKIPDPDVIRGECANVPFQTNHIIPITLLQNPTKTDKINSCTILRSLKISIIKYRSVWIRCEWWDCECNNINCIDWLKENDFLHEASPNTQICTWRSWDAQSNEYDRGINNCIIMIIEKHIVKWSASSFFGSSLKSQSDRKVRERNWKNFEPEWIEKLVCAVQIEGFNE